MLSPSFVSRYAQSNEWTKSCGVSASLPNLGGLVYTGRTGDGVPAVCTSWIKTYGRHEAYEGACDGNHTMLLQQRRIVKSDTGSKPDYHRKETISPASM
jgi:hypothetical protein